MPNRIPLDPALRANFDQTSNAVRSKAELDAWWDHPFGRTLPDGRIEVRCLNGGAHDRSSSLGIADTYEAACVLAEAKQAEWVSMREQPVATFLEGKIFMVRSPQRPDDQEVVLGEYQPEQAAVVEADGPAA